MDAFISVFSFEIIAGRKIKMSLFKDKDSHSRDWNAIGELGILNQHYVSFFVHIHGWHAKEMQKYEK